MVQKATGAALEDLQTCMIALWSLEQGAGLLDQ